MRFQILAAAVLFAGCALEQGSIPPCAPFGESANFDLVEQPGGTCSAYVGSFVAFVPFSVVSAANVTCMADTGWLFDGAACTRTRECVYTFDDGSSQRATHTARLDDTGDTVDVQARFSDGGGCRSTYDVKKR